MARQDKQVRSMTVRVALSLLVSMTLLSGGPLQARDPILDPQESISPTVKDSEGWVEEASDLPAYPLESNLLEFHVDQPASRFRFFIDSESIDTGTSDGVVRYTLVIRSRNGADNVIFEAMHCAAKQYKTFAFGTRQKKFRPVRKPRWRAFSAGASQAYRRDLWDFYLCKGEVRLTRTREQIVDDLKYQRR